MPRRTAWRTGISCRNWLDYAEGQPIETDILKGAGGASSMNSAATCFFNSPGGDLSGLCVQSRHGFTHLPQALGQLGIVSDRVGFHLHSLTEVFTAVAFHFWGTCQVDHTPGPFFWGLGAPPHLPTYQRADDGTEIFPDVGGDQTWVHGVGGDPATLQAPVEFVSEQDVGQLGCFLS